MSVKLYTFSSASLNVVLEHIVFSSCLWLKYNEGREIPFNALCTHSPGSVDYHSKKQKKKNTHTSHISPWEMQFPIQFQRDNSVEFSFSIFVKQFDLICLRFRSFQSNQKPEQCEMKVWIIHRYTLKDHKRLLRLWVCVVLPPTPSKLVHLPDMLIFGKLLKSVLASEGQIFPI